jgi:hypothetical protein
MRSEARATEREIERRRRNLIKAKHGKSTGTMIFNVHITWYGE